MDKIYTRKNPSACSVFFLTTFSLSFNLDLAAVARARPYLRRFSVQDPKLQQFQTRNISNFRRTASLPSRSKRPVLRTRSDAQFRAPDTPCNMLRGKTRIVGQATSPTGMDRGMCLYMCLGGGASMQISKP